MGFSPDVEKAVRYANQLEQDDKDKLIAELQAKLAEIAGFFPVCGEIQCIEQYKKIQAIKGEG